MISMLDQNAFPVMRQSVRGIWAPILLEPISGSPEQLVIGVAAANPEGFHVELANAMHRLRCLYGQNSLAVIAAAQMAGECLKHDLGRRSVQALLEPDIPLTGVKLGQCREGENFSLSQIAQSWLSVMSSLHDAKAVIELDTPAIEDAPIDDVEAVAVGDKLPLLVFDYVGSQSEELRRYFRSDLQQGKARRKKGASHRIVIDFSGPRLVANFGTLRAGALANSVNLIKRRLWDLKVDRDSETHDAFRRAHEMMLFRPAKDDPTVSDAQQSNIAEAIEALEHQADQEELRLEAFDSVSAIGQRLLKHAEAA